MDFHEMKRKELQALCKKHGVPANLTNREMADRLHRLLQNLKSAPQDPISLEPSVLDPSDKGNGVNAAQSARKQPKKVRFSPENQTFIFEASLHKTVGRTTRRRKSCVPSKADDGQTEISGIDEGLKKRNGKFSIRVTRSRAAMIMESDDVDADLPIAPKKRGRLKKEEKSTTEKYDRGTEKVSVKTDKASGKLARMQLRSRQITVLEDTDSVENAQKRPRRSARQEIQPANKNIEAKGTTTAPCSKSVISKNEEAGNGERIGVFETEKATKADCRQGPSTRRRQTLMVTFSAAAIAELDIQESIMEVKKGREAVMGSSSSSVVDLVEDETHVGKQNKELKKKRKWLTGTGAGHSDEKVVRRSPRSVSVIISNMKEAAVLKASENQKESDEYRVRELEDEAPGGKSLALPAAATAMITRTLNSNSLDKAPEFTAKHCTKQVRRSARTASVSSSNISVDPMAKASEKERAIEGLDFPVKSSSSMPIRRSGRNTSESTLHVSIAPVTEASEANRRGECRMERIEEEGPLTSHRRTRMVTSNSEPVTELDIQNSITGLKKQKRPFTNKESDVTWLQNEINSTDSLMAASVKDGISVVGQHMKLKMKRKAARGTRRGTVYEKMVRSSRNTASASTMDVSVAPVAEASASGRRMAKIQEEVLGNEKLMLPEKGGEGNFTSTVCGSANINSSHGALEFSGGSHGSKQVRRSARVALVSSSDALISPVKRTSAKKEESEFITCIEKESPAIGSPPPENRTNSHSEACESSDKGYTNKQVRSSAQIASLSSSGAIIAQTKRASGKKRGSESRRTSTEEKIPETKSLLLPEKTTDSTSGALEFSDKGCNDKQIMRFVGMASASASDASISPVTRASGKKRGSKSRRTSTEEEIPEIKSPLLPEKTTESTIGALEFSDKGCNDKDVMRFPGMASASVSTVSIGPVTRASGLKRECESRIIGIEEVGIKSPSLPNKLLDSSRGALEFSDGGYSSKQVRRSARTASSTSLDASIGPKTRASGKKRESESRISSIKEKASGIQSPWLNKMTDSSYVIEEFSGKGCSSKQVRRSARVASTTSPDASIGLVKRASAEKRESESRITGIEEETSVNGGPSLLLKTDSSNEAFEFFYKGCRNKQVRRSERLASLSPLHASVSPLGTEALEACSDPRMESVEEEAHCSGSLSSPDKTVNDKVELAAPDSATITKNLGSNRSGGASDFSGRSVYNMTEGLMTGYGTHAQLEIAEGEKDSAHADTGASDGNAFFSTSDTAAGELALENRRESEDVIAAIPEKTQCIEITDPVHIEIDCQADGSTSAQTESSGFQLEVPPGDESVNFKCNQMGSNDGTSFQGGQKVIMEAINMTDAKSLDELTREDSTDEASGFCESRMDLKERSLLSVSCTEITEKLNAVHNSLITDETCEEELACSSKNDDRLAAPSEQTSDRQDSVQVTESAIGNEAFLSQMKQADTVTEEIRIYAAVECPIIESLASDMILHEVHEGENLLHDARNEDKLLSQAMDINYEVEGDDMNGDAVEHKGDLHAVSVGKFNIEDGVVETAASLECDAKNKSESLETFNLEIQECKDVNEESRVESSICAVEHKGDLHAVSVGKSYIQDGVVEMAASLECDAKDKPEALETFILEIQECNDVNEESRVESSMELDGLLKMKEMGSDDEYLPLLDKEDDNSFQFNNVKDTDSSDQSAQPCKSSCPLEKTIELTESKRDGILNFEQDADAKDVPSAQGFHQLVSLKESDLSSLDAEVAQENYRNPQDRNYEICDVERDNEQIASPGICKGSEKQEAVISSHFTCPVMQNNRITESPCSTNDCDKTIEAQSRHGVENQVESCGWKVGALSNTEGIYDVNVKDIEHDAMLEAEKEQVMTDDVVFHGVLQHQIFTGNIHDGSNNMDKNVGNDNEAEHSEDKLPSSGETREEFFFDHTARRRFEGPTPAEEWNIDGSNTSFITAEGNNDLNVDEAKGEKMFEADKECVIGGDMISDVAHDPEMLVQGVHAEAESADASLNLNSNEFKDHKGTAGLKDASKHSTEKGHYLFAERELKGQISDHISETMLKRSNNENLEHQSANLQMATDHSAVSPTIFTAEERETHDWLDIAFTLLEDKDGSKIGVTDAAIPAVLGDDIRATSEHGDANMIGSCSNDESKDVCPDKISEEAFCEGSRLPSAGEQSMNTKQPGSTMMTKKSKTCFIPRKTKQFKGIDMKDQPGNGKPQLGSLTASKRRPTRPVWK